MEFVTGIIVGLVIGGGIIYAFQRVRSVRLETQLSERTQQLEKANQDLRDLAQKHVEAQTEAKGHQSTKEALEKSFAERRNEIDTHFKGIASDVLKLNCDEFRKQAEGQLKAGETAVENLVKPVHERLNELQKVVDQSDKSRIADTTKVSNSVDQLMAETSRLRNILGNPQARGDWGEQHLLNVIEAAGMTRHIDYIKQGTIAGDSEGTRLRPDLQVKIPGGVTVVIDAKTPHDRYDEALRSDNKEDQARLFGEHATALTEHARLLAGRDYAQRAEGSPDFVIMYVPTDPMLDAAIKAKPKIWQDIWQRHRVLIATPGLLIAFLRTVALARQQQDIQRNAQKIAESAGELYGRLRTYADHMNKMGDGLRQAVANFNKGVGSFQGRVMPRARDFEKLGVTSDAKRIEDIQPIESNVRLLPAGDGR